MAKNKKPAKKYVPGRWVASANAVERVVESVSPAHQSVQDRLGIVLHGAVHDIIRGKGVRADWFSIKNSLNVCKVLCMMGMGNDYLPDVELAMLAHRACRDRFNTTGSFGYTQLELQSINTAIELHQEQLRHTSVQDVERAVRIAEQAEQKVLRERQASEQTNDLKLAA